MTREEAKSEVDFLDYYLQNHSNDYSEESHMAMRMAYKALEQEPCEDAISRQAVFDLMRSLTRWCVRSEDGKFNNVGLLYDDVMFGIDKLPSVIPKPKMGHWIIIDDCEQFIAKCSECGRIEDSRMISKYSYCHCGAKMIEPQESEG